ncbi:MAG: hypothetical protein RR512_08025 [Coprobacillus sp.]
MKKTVGIIMPYIIVAFVLAMNYISIEYQNIMISLVVGLLVGIWMFAVSKCVGTMNMKILTGANCFIFIAGIIIALLLNEGIMLYLSTTIGLLVPLNFISYYVLSQNKPKLHMSYGYSYKNRKRRYF